MKRRVLAMLAALALMIALPAFAFAADTELVVRAPGKAPAVGESFTVTVEIRGNPGINTAQFTLQYDKEMLECVSMEAGPVADQMLNAMNEDAPAGAMFAGAAINAAEEDGVIVICEFKVLIASAEVPRSLTNCRFGDVNRNQISYMIVQETESDSGQGTDPGTTTEPDPGTTTETPDPGTAEDPTGGEAENSGQTETAALEFSDIGGHWGEQYIRKAAEMKLFTGFPDGSFQPNGKVTRAQYVTVLWRMAGEPVPAEPAPFGDVPAGLWYSDAVAWAYGQGYVSGRSETVFDPNGSITRQEAMKILFAFSGGVSGMEAMLTGIYDADFADSGDIAAWAKPAMYWGYYKGIINGKTTTTLCPKDTATRAELAKILVIYAEKAADGTI